jgi:lactoylglutathione lyase
MKFEYTIVYVDDVEQTLAFYNRAFGFETRFLHETKTYGELETGETVLAFASHELGRSNLGEYTKADAAKPLGIEIAFVTKDVASAFEQAVAAGAQPLSAPVMKPWGQMVAYVRAPEGTVIELGSPMDR